MGIKTGGRSRKAPEVGVTGPWGTGVERVWEQTWSGSERGQERGWAGHPGRGMTWPGWPQAASEPIPGKCPLGGQDGPRQGNTALGDAPSCRMLQSPYNSQTSMSLNRGPASCIASARRPQRRRELCLDLCGVPSKLCCLSEKSKWRDGENGTQLII